jgi:hypothetical protein
MPRYENRCFYKAGPGDIIGLEDYIYEELVVKKKEEPLEWGYKFAEETLDV